MKGWILMDVIVAVLGNNFLNFADSPHVIHHRKALWPLFQVINLPCLFSLCPAGITFLNLADTPYVIYRWKAMRQLIHIMHFTCPTPFSFSWGGSVFIFKHDGINNIFKWWEICWIYVNNVEKINKKCCFPLLSI